MLAALAACTKTTISPNDDLTNALNPSSGAPIAFETEDAFTKAVIDNINDLQVEGNKFRVWSHFQGTTSGPMFTEDGTEVEYKKLNEESIPQYGWTYNPTRYWLNGTYDFAAVYPSTVTGTYAPATAGATPTLTINNFDVTTQDDLLVAFNNGPDGNGIDGSQGKANNPVELKFQHALSCIQLKLTLDEEDFFEPTENGGKRQVGYASVSIVGFNNIATKATLTTSGTVDTPLFWNQYGPMDVAYPSKPIGQMRLNYTDDPLPVTLQKQDFFGPDGMLVLPQQLADENGEGAGELYMRVVITNSIGSDSQSITKEIKVPLVSGVDEWLPNTKYIYEGVVTQELIIEFNVIKVNNWQDEPLGGFIVN